jgi:hypothetical protein
LAPRVYGEAGLFEDVVGSDVVDLARRDGDTTLNADPALTIVASANPAVYARHAVTAPADVGGVYRINPLYKIEERVGNLHLTLTFPDAAYEDEYGACRRYLPDAAIVPSAALQALQESGEPGTLHDLVTRKVIVFLPAKYY